MTDLEQEFDELIVRPSIGGLPRKSAFQLIGTLINLSSDLKRSEGTTRAIHWCEELSKQNLSSYEIATLEYFRAHVSPRKRRLTATSCAAIQRLRQDRCYQDLAR